VYGIGWKAAALAVMVLLGIYSVAIRKFFCQNGDWRIFLPVAGLIGLISLAYWAYSFKEIKFTMDAVLYGVVILTSICLATVLSLLVYADPEARLNIAVPLMSLAMVSTAILSIVFLGESITIQTIAGILFAIVAIVLLSWG